MRRGAYDFYPQRLRRRPSLTPPESDESDSVVPADGSTPDDWSDWERITRGKAVGAGGRLRIKDECPGNLNCISKYLLIQCRLPVCGSVRSRSSTASSHLPSTITVTGSSSGFGLEMARCALKHGDKVVATLRKPDVLRELAARHTPDQLLFVKVDVTKPDEIKEAFRRAKAAFGRVDVVFNNAGYVVAGEVEAVPDDPARAMFETNFWGAAHVSQEAVRFFRDENKPQGGHLITNTAAGGLSGYPIIGWYCASKHGEYIFLI